MRSLGMGLEGVNGSGNGSGEVGWGNVDRGG